MPSSYRSSSRRSLEKALLRFVRALPIRRAHNAWMVEIERHPHIDALLKSKGDYRTRHLQSYMHRRWKGRRKLDTIRTHVAFVMSEIVSSQHDAIYAQNGVTLDQWEAKEQIYRLVLLRSQHNKEGEFQLSLRDSDDNEIYFLVFSIGNTPDTHSRCLYIGCLQGAKPEQGGTTLINAFYKANHGLRAQSLLMTSLYAFKAVFGLGDIYAISDRCTINSRYRHKIKTSYNEFWESCQAVAGHDGWYQLPAQEPERDIAAVKSKHRSTFRKREALREEVRARTFAVLQSLKTA